MGRGGRRGCGRVGEGSFKRWMTIFAKKSVAVLEN